MSVRIAVCLPSAPFIRGGAELFADRLVERLRARDYEVELIAVPFRWYPRQAIMRHAILWRLLDLTESNGERIDLVIATKFPSYLVKHPNKVTFLLHQFKMVYEMWGTAYCDFSGKPNEKRMRKQIKAIDAETLPESRAIFAISERVGRRLEINNGLTSEYIYHPSPLEGQIAPGLIGDTLLAVGRLDRLKRLDLLLAALAKSKTKPKTIIAGAGPEEKNLRRLAEELGVAKIVEFTGRLPEQKIIELYHSCAAVWFAPFDEDYGYVAIEAMMAAKPVITADDSGAVIELIDRAGTGIVAQPDRQSMAAAIDSLIEDRDRAARLGQAGPTFTSTISWDKVVEALTRTVK